MCKMGSSAIRTRVGTKISQVIYISSLRDDIPSSEEIPAINRIPQDQHITISIPPISFPQLPLPPLAAPIIAVLPKKEDSGYATGLKARRLCPYQLAPQYHNSAKCAKMTTPFLGVGTLIWALDDPAKTYSPFCQRRVLVTCGY